MSLVSIVTWRNISGGILLKKNDIRWRYVACMKRQLLNV